MTGKPKTTGFADGYVDVAERIGLFREKHPEGCLRPADPAQPFRVETVGDRTFIVVVAAAYRTPDDPCPGIGMAWEPFPGPTSFTRDSELQNAETSAWGRAIVAALAADTKRGIATSEEVRNRRPAPPAEPAQDEPKATAEQLSDIDALLDQLPANEVARVSDALVANYGPDWRAALTSEQVAKTVARLHELVAKHAKAAA